MFPHEFVKDDIDNSDDDPDESFFWLDVSGRKVILWV
jgi:hypothetical protein